MCLTIELGHINIPEHAKRFQSALADNVRRYEDSHGEISSKEHPTIPLNFGPAGEA